MILTMYDHDPLWLLLKTMQPCQKSVHICVTTDPLQAFNLRIDHNTLAKDLNALCTFYKLSSKSSHCLISYKANGTFFTPEIVLQMMSDTSCITHAGS